jgi:phospholipase A-2-activating protein
LVEYPGLGFLSCGNDGVIKAWSLEGDLIRECHGHTSFIYSLSLVSPTEFVSCGEDGTVRYWSNFELKQTIKLPCISVWSVCGIPNTTDFVVGSSDPIVRVFSRDPSKWASEEELKVGVFKPIF